MHDPRAIERKVFELLEAQVARSGMELVAVEVTGEGGRRVLRVSVDRPGGIHVDQLGELSRRISPLLDAEAMLHGPYDLEMSSPGIERPVQRTEDFQRFAGFRAKIRVAPGTGSPGAGRRRFSGVLRGLRGTDVLIEVDGAEHAIPLSQVERAHLVLDLDEYQKLAEEPPPHVPTTGGDP